MSEPITAYVVRRELHAAPTPSDLQRVTAGETIDLLPGVPGVRWAVVEYSPDEAREEGRREILREIAALDSKHQFDVLNELSYCQFCESDLSVGAVSDGSMHANDCLWLRAQQAAKETP